MVDAFRCQSCTKKARQCAHMQPMKQHTGTQRHITNQYCWHAGACQKHGNPMPAKTLQSRSVNATCMGGSNTTHSQKPQRQQTQPQNPGNVNISASLPCCNASRRAQCSHRAAAAGRALRVLQTLRSLSLKPQRPPTPPLPTTKHPHTYSSHALYTNSVPLPLLPLLPAPPLLAALLLLPPLSGVPVGVFDCPEL